MTSTAQPAGTTRPMTAGLILILGALVALGPLTIDMYLPAFPAIAEDLSASGTLVQLTLTGTLLGLAAGQLLIGPLSDAAGRRLPLILGIALHVVASGLAVLAWDITVLGVLRVLQGVGAAAATVVAMAVVRDVSAGSAAAVVISRLMLVMGAAPVLAPSLGGVVLLAGSWRWIFAVLAVAGAMLILLAVIALPETLPPQRRRSGPGQALRGYRAVLGDGRFILLIVVVGLAFGCLFGYIAGSSFVFQRQYGLGELQYALVFGAAGLVLIGGAQLNPPLLRRIAPERIIAGALGLICVAGLALVAAQAAGAEGIAWFMLPLFCMLAGVSLTVPNVTALALSRHGEAAGTAAAVLGAAQFGLGAAVTPLVGVLGNDGLATAAVMTGCGAMAAVGFVFYLMAGRRART
ncbi:multidrug effflux MFS transporter [Sediminivirga luteola]|uniref:Putative multidrug resistance transporter, Bcr/CflA family protein n=1 Tax=Sediminivirga luteola TaxID=1774748 RepID=A0A8J2TZ53_9MICO|nr:multidrug effflux MFS transporter [Sediminivirga luteola]GGA18835.1 putative multidrug resistance transporter, Bcr/CflA family protein [Sediminivirga luteola]